MYITDIRTLFGIVNTQYFLYKYENTPNLSGKQTPTNIKCWYMLLICKFYCLLMDKHSRLVVYFSWQWLWPLDKSVIKHSTGYLNGKDHNHLVSSGNSNYKRSKTFQEIKNMFYLSIRYISYLRISLNCLCFPSIVQLLLPPFINNIIQWPPSLPAELNHRATMLDQVGSECFTTAIKHFQSQ